MVVIPAGNFLMGAPADESGRNEIEGPQRRVTIAQFSAGKFDITLAQWKAFVKDTNRKTVGGCAWAPSNQDLNPDASWEKLGFPQDDTHPVVCGVGRCSGLCSLAFGQDGKKISIVE
jgi:formylglycine-generating enzyme required for sulfatase activity